MDALEVLALALGGLAAGVLSTVAGMGGGILLVVAISLALGPHAALATTAPALLLGNLHRLWLFRHALDRKVATSFLVGALPGALLGGLVSAQIPESALQWVLLGVTGLALLRASGRLAYEPPASAYVPAAFGVGIVAAGSGAGILVSPLLVAGGLAGDALIATGSAACVAMHVGRITGYGIGGLFGGAALGISAVLAGGILSGNAAGERLRAQLGEARCMRLTYAVLAVCVLLAVAGIAGGERAASP